MKITLTPEQLKNLSVFLARVQLTGAEVGAFQDLVKAISQSEKEEEDK